MAWRIVKQPDGRFARFSDIVDNFTHMNLTESEAIDVCIEGGLTSDQAFQKVLAGKEDHQPWSNSPGTGLERWNNSLETIKFVHGKSEVKKVKEYLKG